MTTSTDVAKRLLIVLSGPSGVGKDAVIGALPRHVGDVHYVVTVTTRSPRPGEQDGRDYHFVSQAGYEQLVSQDRLLAAANVHGHWYGAPVQEITDAFRQGNDALLKIDVKGAMQVRRRLPQAVYIFIAPPSLDDLIGRLKRRHTEVGQELDRRMADARAEMAEMTYYEYVVVNRDEDVEGTAAEVGCIITAERLRQHRQPIHLTSIDDVENRH